MQSCKINVCMLREYLFACLGANNYRFNDSKENTNITRMGLIIEELFHTVSASLMGN